MYKACCGLEAEKKKGWYLDSIWRAWCDRLSSCGTIGRAIVSQQADVRLYTRYVECPRNMEKEMHKRILDNRLLPSCLENFPRFNRNLGSLQIFKMTGKTYPCDCIRPPTTLPWYSVTLPFPTCEPLQLSDSQFIRLMTTVFCLIHHVFKIFNVKKILHSTTAKVDVKLKFAMRGKHSPKGQNTVR